MSDSFQPPEESRLDSSLDFQHSALYEEYQNRLFLSRIGQNGTDVDSNAPIPALSGHVIMREARVPCFVINPDVERLLPVTMLTGLVHPLRFLPRLPRPNLVTHARHLSQSRLLRVHGNRP